MVFNFLKSYFTIKGRSSRTEFWLSALFCFLVKIFSLLFDKIFAIESNIYTLSFNSITGITSWLLWFIMLFVSIRRLHDIGKSGWMYFIVFIPFIGQIWFLYLMLKKSDTEENIYGEKPNNY